MTSHRHIIRPRWLRITLRTLFWLVIVLLALPWLLYIPPVQTLVKNIACDAVYKSTGMKIGVDRLRIRFPLDVELAGVSVIEASGDTMVSARSAVADVKMRPLLNLDIRLNRLQLNDGYYRMVSPDSSMTLAVRAGLLEVDEGSSFSISGSELDLSHARVRDGHLSLLMDVWKQKPTPTDTASTPFLIKARSIDLDNFAFDMSMLPTIDTLSLQLDALHLDKGVVDLRTNTITAALLSLAGGNARYITPTPEYVASHPLPAPDTTAVASAPMVIRADSISLSGFDVLYAVSGARPLPGFDASYISMSEVGIGMRGFYNEASTVRLPLTRLSGRERCGLVISDARGTVNVDSTGLSLDSLRVNTPYSRVAVTAGIPFALMALQPSAPLNATLKASIGLPDVDAFMPSLSEYTSKVPRRSPLQADLHAAGTLADVKIDRLKAALPGVFALDASGTAANALDYKKLRADIRFDTRLQNPHVVESLIGKLGFPIPQLTLRGNAHADAQNYAADFDLILPEGTVAGAGKVSMTSENYAADIAVNHIDVGRFAPGTGLGPLTARLKARGQSFNPEKRGARTDVSLDLASLRYRDQTLTDITAVVSLLNGLFTVDASSLNPGAGFDISGHGTVGPDLYTFDLKAHLADIDLQKLGFSTTEFNARGDLLLKGKASPARWLYDTSLDVASVDIALEGDRKISLPDGMRADFLSTDSTVSLTADAAQTAVAFNSRSGLRRLIDSFTKAAAEASRQIAARDVYVDSLRMLLPPIDLRAEASGRGALGALLAPSGVSLDTVSVALSTDSLLTAHADVLNIVTSGMVIDTVSLGLRERGSLLDYALHVGNRPGNLDEFADVNINGYAGANRLSAYAVQHNTKGEMGYRLGLTAAITDSIVTVHFTPLKAMVAYMPWTFNSDNHIDYNVNNMHIDADLAASSAESAISIKTLPSPRGGDELAVKLTNINVEDFLKLSLFAPPLTACVNSDLNLYYNGHGFEGEGTLDVSNFTYAKTRIGDLDLDFNAGLDNNGDTRAEASLRIDKARALTAHAMLRPDSVGSLHADSLWMALNHFPLSLANPFLGPDVASLSGSLTGRIDMSGTFSAPLLNGSLATDSAGVYLPITGTTLRLDNEPITVADNVVGFNQYDIFAINKNPLTINGTVDASSFSHIGFNLTAKASNIQLVGNDRRAGTPLYGKLFMDLDASVHGPMNLLDINATADVLGTTDVTYTVEMAGDAIAQQQTSDVVKFVNFSDTTVVVKADSIAPAMAMRINASATLSPGMMATVLLGSDGKVQISPSGTLNFFQNYMGDMRLNGQLNLGEGNAYYNVPVMGKKEFDINPSSFVAWNGDIMNPTLHLDASDKMKVNIKDQGGNTRLVNFLIGLSVTNSLSAPKVTFDLSTDDDMTIQNELASMTPDQRSTQAMNLLLYGQYTGPGVTTQSNDFLQNNLYSFLTNKLNNWAANTIRGVDLSFGVDQYNQTRDGQNSSTMSYSYQVSKSLFNNRFKINVGGNYSTDASADENFEQNLISDISFEYMLKQTNTLSMYVSLFRHNGYESILEGEVTETGAGFVMRRRLSSLRHLFRLGRRKSPLPGTALTPGEAAREEKADSIRDARQRKDSIVDPGTREPAKLSDDEEYIRK